MPSVSDAAFSRALLSECPAPYVKDGRRGPSLRQGKFLCRNHLRFQGGNMRTTILVTLILILGGLVYGQNASTITGTAVIYGSGMNTRTVSRTFTLRIKGTTSPA